jgi:hypothetical protein
MEEKLTQCTGPLHKQDVLFLPWGHSKEFREQHPHQETNREKALQENTKPAFQMLLSLEMWAWLYLKGWHHQLFPLVLSCLLKRPGDQV